MTCPINDIRNFKATRSEQTTDNVVNIRKEAPIAALHFARAEEADIEVEFTNPTETLTCETETMQTINVNDTVETVSMTAVTERYKKIRRNNIIANVCGSIATTVALAGAAHLAGRDVKRGVIMVGVVSGVTLANELFGKYRKAEAKQQAEHFSEDEYQEAITNKPSEIASGALVSLAVGALIGGYLIRKVATPASTEE